MDSLSVTAFISGILIGLNLPPVKDNNDKKDEKDESGTTVPAS